MNRAVVFLLAVLTILPATAQETNLKLVSDVWPPFTNIEPNQSFAIDLVNESLRRSGVTAKTVFLEFKDVIERIRDSTYHGSAAMWHSDERASFLIFSAPYLQNQLILVGRKGSDVSQSSFKDLGGQRVAVVGTYAYGGEVEEAGSVILVYGASDQENLERLIKEEVDYMLVDALLMQYLMTHQNEEVTRHLQIGSKVLFKRSLHFALRRDLEGAQAIINRFNKEILKMVSDGTYHNILQLNWIRADIDGDGKMELIASGEQAGKQAPASGYSIWFQNPSSTPSNNRYYIGGQIYHGWDNVPKEYKVQPVDEKQEDFKLMKFSF